MKLVLHTARINNVESAKVSSAEKEKWGCYFQLFPALCRLSDLTSTVEPRFNEPLFNEVLDITNDIISMSRPKLQ